MNDETLYKCNEIMQEIFKMLIILPKKEREHIIKNLCVLFRN